MINSNQPPTAYERIAPTTSYESGRNETTKRPIHIKLKLDRKRAHSNTGSNGAQFQIKIA